MYNFHIRLCVADLLQRKWGTSLLSDITLFGNKFLIYDKVKKYYNTGTMVLVQLPADILGRDVKVVGGADNSAAHQITYDHAELIQNKLFYDYQIEASKHPVINNCLFHNTGAN